MAHNLLSRREAPPKRQPQRQRMKDTDKKEPNDQDTGDDDDGDSSSSSSLFLKALQRTRFKVESVLTSAVETHMGHHAEYHAATDSLDVWTVKNALLMTYLLELVHWRLSPSDKSRHRLQQVKVLLERLGPMERKMRYSIDKLLSLSHSEQASFASGGGGASASRGEGGGGGVVVGEASDPLSFRPHVDGLLPQDDRDDEHKDDDHDDDEEKNSDDDDDDDDDAADDDDEDLKAAKAAVAAARNGQTRETDKTKKKDDEETLPVLYKPPKTTFMAFSGDKEEPQAAAAADKVRRGGVAQARRLELYQALQTQYGQVPPEEESLALSSSSRTMLDYDKERQEAEESAMVRWGETRAEKQQRRRREGQGIAAVSSMAHIGRLADDFLPKEDWKTKKHSRRPQDMAVDQSKDSSLGKRKHRPGTKTPKNALFRAAVGYETSGGSKSKKKKRKGQA